MTTLAPSNTARSSLSPHQPYTAPFLARLSMFVLHAPLDTVKSTLSPTSTLDGGLPHMDPNSHILRPSEYTNGVCQRVLRLLNELTLRFPRADHPSPDTIPLALCLLFRHRVALTSTSQREDAPRYEYCGTSELIPVPISHPPGPQLSDASLIALSVHVAYKFLTNDRNWVNMQHWVQPLELNKQDALKDERCFLYTINYGVWVQQEEFVHLRGRLDVLWKEIYIKAGRPAPPAFVLKRLGRLC